MAVFFTKYVMLFCIDRVLQSADMECVNTKPLQLKQQLHDIDKVKSEEGRRGAAHKPSARLSIKRERKAISLENDHPPPTQPPPPPSSVVVHPSIYLRRIIIRSRSPSLQKCPFKNRNCTRNGVLLRRPYVKQVPHPCHIASVLFCPVDIGHKICK